MPELTSKFKVHSADVRKGLRSSYDLLTDCTRASQIMEGNLPDFKSTDCVLVTFTKDLLHSRTSIRVCIAGDCSPSKCTEEAHYQQTTLIN